MKTKERIEEENEHLLSSSVIAVIINYSLLSPVFCRAGWEYVQTAICY